MLIVNVLYTGSGYSYQQINLSQCSSTETRDILSIQNVEKEQDQFSF